MVESKSQYPRGLQTIIDLFQSLPDEEKRETLISYAEQAPRWAPKAGERFDLEDVRKDEECTDTVGVFLKVTPNREAIFRVSLGPQVQTLTRAMTSMLQGVTPTDPWTFAAVIAVTGLVAVAASVGPARRAGKTDPARVLTSS